MEINGYMGRVVAVPTAGSCGVIPGTLLGAGKYAGYPEKDIVRALLCAGMIGVGFAVEHKNLAGSFNLAKFYFCAVNTKT
jgi:L-serine dehydratase